MDRDSQRTSQDVPLSAAHVHVNGGFLADHSTNSAVCALCRRILVPDNDDLETISICGDCKFLLLEDLETPFRDSHRRRPHRGRRTRYSSSDSIDNHFSQQFSQVINLARQNQSTFYGNEDRSIDGDSSARLLQRMSSHTTPSSSRRWQRLFQILKVRVLIMWILFTGRVKVISDPVDMFIQADEGSNFDSDTDIDPMHAGLHQWNSDDLEEEEDEEDGEWEEADIEEDTNESIEAGARLHNLFISGPIEGNGPVSWRRQFHSPEFEDLSRWRTRQIRQAHNHDFFTNLEESELPQHIGNSELGDYATGFGDLLEALAHSEIGRRGAPPAALSFVNNLPCIIINEEHEKHDGLVCAICKDLLPIGTEVNQLPCLHLYHPSCILPWLSARNSCPLCRYEFPTDDQDYEEGKRNAGTRTEIHGIQQQEVSEDSSSDVSDEPLEHGQRSRELLDVGPLLSSSGGEGSRRRWFLLAAAPLVSLLGIVLVMWWGNPQRRRANSHCNLHERGLRRIQVSGSSHPNQRGNGRRRWWSFFEEISLN
ncbi:unnamed protein product [Dovyalis caffra]|uniref:RING-type E3 ubiquitin transferase n=1 Tax=Dovyalis caffra TaxID=77055 RepID=A0AAV1S333_9ROSI|nr:unnamed protein product [Dovyalis caffra]